MITRIVDGLGRIALPVEFRHELKIRDGSKLNMTLENGAIVLRPSNLHLKQILETITEKHGVKHHFLK